MRKTKEEAENTRLAILQSAQDVLYEKGYAKTTFDEIAKRIHLTKGAVYWHFRNKPDIISALITDYLDRQIAYLDENLPKIKTFDDLVNFYIYSADFIMSSESNRKAAFFMTCRMEWSEELIKNVSSAIEKKEKYCFKYVKEALTFLQNSGHISKDFDAQELAVVFSNIWTGILWSYFGKGFSGGLQKMVKESFDLIYNGLKCERTENAGK